MREKRRSIALKREKRTPEDFTQNKERKGESYVKAQEPIHEKRM